MVLVILGVCVALIFIGCAINEHSYDGSEAGAAISVIGFIGGIIALVATICIGAQVLTDSKLDSKIAMYTEENAVIEQQIADCVERYQEYEQGVFEKVSPTDAVAVVTLYPELKSDTLVQAQIETYVENNNKIKQLKERKIDASVRKWWLYFGG